MIAILLVSGFIVPPIMFCLLYFNITEQHDIIEKDDDAYLVVVQTKEEAQADVRYNLIRSPWFWLWCTYTSLVLIITCIGFLGV